jgi:periplasmic protein CpxP/Spy
MDMKSIFKLVPALLVVFVLGSADTIAQEQDKEPMPPDERAAKLTDWMKTNLQLTAEQEKPVQEINLKYAIKTEELRNTDEPRKEKFKKLKGYNEEKDKELKKVFTEEQFKLYLAKKEEVKEEFKAKAKEKKKAGQ